VSKWSNTSATQTIARGTRWEDTIPATCGGGQLLELAESVTTRRSAEVISLLVIREWPSVNDFHPLSQTGSEILASSVMPALPVSEPSSTRWSPDRVRPVR
jgi:hypothetical protein